MANPASTGILLNPNTYLNHLPTDEAAQFEVVRGVYIVFLGATIWDIFAYIPEDIKIVRICGGWITNTCFLLARVLAVIHMGLWVLVATHPLTDCNPVMRSINVLCLLTMSVTSFLFLRRVQAVYTGNRFAWWIFGFLWFGTSAASVMLFHGTRSDHIPGTHYCILYALRQYVSATSFMPVAFDTLVFFAISYKIAFQSITHSGSSWHMFFSGKALPALSRAVLQGGQLYYLVTFGMTVLNGAFEFSSSLPPMLRTLFSVPLVAIIACMTCRAHRVMATAFYDPIDSADRAVTHDIRFAKSSSDEGNEGTTRNYSTQTGAGDGSGTRNGLVSEVC